MVSAVHCLALPCAPAACAAAAARVTALLVQARCAFLHVFHHTGHVEFALFDLQRQCHARVILYDPDQAATTSLLPSSAALLPDLPALEQTLMPLLPSCAAASKGA